MMTIQYFLDCLPTDHHHCQPKFAQSLFRTVTNSGSLEVLIDQQGLTVVALETLNFSLLLDTQKLLLSLSSGTPVKATAK